MDKKTISFRAKQREKRESRVHPKNPGEMDDFVIYWRRMFHNPLQRAGRQVWTERMLWSNALVAALIHGASFTFEQGFHFIYLVSNMVNTFFVFFLVYYVMTWIIAWVLDKTGSRMTDVQAIRLQIIILSGWLVLASVMTFVPIMLAYDAVLLVFLVLTARAVKHATGAPWWRAGAATSVGGLGLFVILVLLGQL